MKKKFYNLFIINSIITFLILVLFILFSILKTKTSLNFAGFINESFLTILLIILSISSFILIILLKKKKYNLDADSLKAPISYLAFAGLIIIVSFILNCYVIIPYIHFVYYYNFILIAYILYDSYVLLSFKK